MKAAGLDLGSTLAKAVWRDPGAPNGLALRRCERAAAPALLDELRAAGVRRLGVTGTGFRSLDLAGFAASEVTGADIDREVAVQARGARALLAAEGRPIAGSMLVVSVGTGVSYGLSAPGAAARRFPLGSALGGGFLRGLGALLGAPDFAALAAESASGHAADILVADLLPETSGTPVGELVVAHFGRADAATPRPDALASLVATVATSIGRDLALLAQQPGWGLPEAVVFLGSTLALPALAAALEGWTRRLGATPYLPALGAHALALGALLTLEDAAQEDPS
ncbi:MAG: hypothetical protein AB7N76_30485 [Planctomycetota bacterium]